MTENRNRKQFSPPFCRKNEFLGFSRAVQCPLLWAQEVDIWASKFTHGAEHSGQSSRSQLKQNIPLSLGAQCMGATRHSVFPRKISEVEPIRVYFGPFTGGTLAHISVFFLNWNFRVTRKIVVFRRKFGIFFQGSGLRYSCQNFIPDGTRGSPFSALEKLAQHLRSDLAQWPRK